MDYILTQNTVFDKSDIPADLLEYFEPAECGVCYICRMVAVFREVRRVLRPDGVCFVNMGDSYAGSGGAHSEEHANPGISKSSSRSGVYGVKPDAPGYKPLDLMGIPDALKNALKADGWYHRSTIIWYKNNPMPESVQGTRWERHRIKVGEIRKRTSAWSEGTGRHDNYEGNFSAVPWNEYTDCPGCAKCEPHGGLVLRRGAWRPTTSHEYIFMLTKTAGYWADGEAVREAAVYGENLPSFRGGGMYTNNQSFNNSEGPSASTGGIERPTTAGRNARTVWEFPTAPYSGAVTTSHLRRVPKDEVSDGMICIPSPNCPDHAGLLVQVARDFYGERKDDLMSRIENICNHLSLKPFADCVPTDQQRALGFEGGMMGYFPRSYSPTAIDHNNETHRMALALGSNPAYIPFFEIVSRIADRSRLLVSFVQHLCIYGNSILQDDTDGHLLARIPHRIVDISSHHTSGTCLCQYYVYYTRDTDHFATYPPELPRRCLKASLSERGVCPECGAQWARVVDKDTHFEGGSGKAGRSAEDINSTGKWAGIQYGTNLKLGPVVDTTTLGWLPTCECNAGDPVPAIVLDPFAGSGTTGLVARELGAHFVGLDLSYAYLHDQARERLGLAALDAWAKGAGKQDGKVITDLPLFGGER